MKHILLLLALLSSTIALLSVEELGFCRNALNIPSGCLLPLDNFYEASTLTIALLTLPAYFLYPFRNTLLMSWVKFAAWGAPVVWLILAWLWYETDGNLFGFSDAMITVPILAVVYTWYFMQSLLVVFSARRNEKGKSPLSLWWGIGSTIALVTFSTLAFIIIAMI